MNYWLRKIVSRFLFPVPLAVALLLVGVALLWWTRRQRAGKVAVTIGVVGLYLMGLVPVSGRVLGSLESRYPVLAEPGALQPRPAWIAVLGMGYNPDRRLPANSRIPTPFLARLMEAVRVHRALPESRILLSLSGPAPVQEKEAFVAEFAAMVGIDARRVTLLTAGRDTEAEVHLIRDQVGNAPFVLVTCASHIPRAVGLCRKLGLNPIPAPTRPEVVESPAKIVWTVLGSIVPCAAGYTMAERAAYEYMGLAWAKLRRRI